MLNDNTQSSLKAIKVSMIKQGNDKITKWINENEKYSENCQTSKMEPSLGNSLWLKSA